jgi:hypothetical protein
MQELVEASTRLEIESARLVAEIDAELARLGPARPLPVLRRRRYALAARRPARRVSGGSHPID